MKKSIGLNATLNALKQMCSVLFPLLTIPYVSRVLQVENYGKVTFANSVISYFTLIAGLGIANYAIREGAVIRNDKHKLTNFGNEVFTINMISTLISYGLLGIILLTISYLQEYRLLLLIQSTSMIFTVLGADWINAIYEDYLYITIRYLLIQVLSITSLFIFVHKTNDYIIYAIIWVCASVGANIFNIFYIRKNYIHLKLIKNCNFFLHIKPILLLFFSYVAMTIYVNSDTTMLGFIKGDTAVGIYGVSTKIYIAIKQILNAIVIVTIPRFSEYVGQKDDEKYKLLLKNIFNISLILLFPCIVGLFWISKDIVIVISGIEYINAFKSLRILSLSLLPAVLANFYSNCILLPYKMERYIMNSAIISALVNIGLNIFLIPILSYNGAALTTLISEYLVFLIMHYYGKIYTKDIFSKETIFSILIGCFLISVICISIQNLISFLWLRIILSIILSIISYILILVLSKNTVFILIIKQIKKKNYK